MKYLKHSEVRAHNPCKREYKKWLRLFPVKDNPKGMKMTWKNLKRMADAGIRFTSFSWLGRTVFCNLNIFGMDRQCVSVCKFFIPIHGDLRHCGRTAKHCAMFNARALYEANKEAK